MKKVIGIKFKYSAKVYYFEANDGLEYKLGSGVIAETSKGIEYATITKLPFEINTKRKGLDLKPILRFATEEDEAAAAENDLIYREALFTAKELVEQMGLAMSIANLELSLDKEKMIINYIAENRVDFRDFVRRLSSIYKRRVEMKQIGVRDECCAIGSLGCCGRVCCCVVNSGDYPSVSIKMAKNQGLSLNPTKISGTCGRLMCCLSYENNHYAEINKRLPKMGSSVKTVDGKEGTVVGLAHLKERVKLKIMDKESYSFGEYPLKDLIFKARVAKEEVALDDKDDDGLTAVAQDDFL